MTQSYRDRFSRAAQWTSQQCGRAYTFVGAIVIIVALLSTYFRYLAAHINTGTTIITFLMVFLIQNTQNRDTTAIQLKLDELIRANEHAQNRIMKLEDLTENQIKHLKEATVGGGPKGTFGRFRGYRGGQKSPPLTWLSRAFAYGGFNSSPAIDTSKSRSTGFSIPGPTRDRSWQGRTARDLPRCAQAACPRPLESSSPSLPIIHRFAARVRAETPNMDIIFPSAADV